MRTRCDGARCGVAHTCPQLAPALLRCAALLELRKKKKLLAAARMLRRCRLERAARRKAL